MSDQTTTGPGPGTKRLFSRLLSPAGAVKMEAESRTWIVHCPKCGYDRSIWDMGGLIYKGAGTRYWRMRCPHCGQTSWHKVYWPEGVKKRDVYAAALAKAGPVSNRPPVLVWIVAAVVWLGLITGVVFLFGFLLYSLLPHR